MFSNILLGAAGFPVADLGTEISNSLRFAGGQKLSRAFGQNHDLNCTISLWLKRGKLSSLQTVFVLDTGQNGIPIRFTSSNEFVSIRQDSGTQTTHEGNFRDTGAWYHICMTNHKCWVNGVEITSGTWISGSENQDDMTIGCYGDNNSQHFDGYIADFYYFDGSHLNQNCFGRYNEDGVWVPKTAVNTNGTALTAANYGDNGFHLDFADSSDPGNDVSGNNHDFTASGFDTSAVSSSNISNDVGIPDTPTTLYPTYNFPACHSSQTLSNANLATSASSYTFAPATISIPADCGKKFYWEVTVTNVSGNPTIGMTDPTQRVGQQSAYNWVWAPTLEDIESPQGNISNLVDTGVSTVNTASGTTYMFAYDADTQNVWIGDNGNWYKRDGAAGVGNPGAGTNPFLTTSDNCIIDGNTYAPCTAGSSAGTTAYEMNFGQFDFQHTMPTGFERLKSDALPEPTIKDGEKHFKAITYAGNGTDNRAITDLEFQPDFLWIKQRTDNGVDHYLTDAIMGADRFLRSNSVNPMNTTSDGVKSFDSNGFTLATGSMVNENNKNYVAWAWNAGGTSVTNTAGDRQATVRANTDAGFSIIDFIGDQDDSTVGHGLNQAPDFVIAKCRGVGQTAWQMYWSVLGVDKFLNFTTGAATTSSGFWGSASDWNSTTCGIGPNDAHHNKDAEGMRWYAWHNVEGFSRFGDYTGNGSADGAFVYTGFKPAMLIIKRENSSDHWAMYDNARDTDNPVTRQLKPDLPSSSSNGADNNSSNNAVDFLANGFKIRTSDSRINGNASGSNHYVYACWAEHPFVGENVPPATAR